MPPTKSRGQFERTASVRGEVLKAARMKKGWGQDELVRQAARLEPGLRVSLGTVQRAERGGPCYLTTIRALAVAIGVEPTALISELPGSRPNGAAVPDGHAASPTASPEGPERPDGHRGEPDPPGIVPARTFPFHPFDPFKRFDEVRHLLEPRPPTEAVPHDVLADVLLHSIQPAYYLKKLELLDDDLVQIGENPAYKDPSPALANARMVAHCACRLYKAIVNKKGTQAFQEVRDELDVRLRTEGAPEELLLWTDAIRLDFLGLCELQLYVQLSKNHARAEAIEHLDGAIREFGASLARFDEIRSGSRKLVVALWKGYVCRNLAASLGHKGDNDRAESYYKAALDHREKVYHAWKFDCHPTVKEHMKIELQMINIDLAILNEDADEFGRLAKKLLHKQGANLLGMWAYVEEFFYESALKLKRFDVAEEVIRMALKEPLFHLVGGPSARRILDRMGEMRIIRDVLTSHAE